MRILFGISHPKHVYIFKNVIINLIQKGHEIKIIAVDKEITAYLLDKFNMPCTVIGKNQPSIYKKLLNLPKWEYLTYGISKEFKPDIFVSRALPHFAHVSTILKKPFIIFEDFEAPRALHKITLPFANAIITPDWYKKDHGKKHIRFNSYFELGYLHPKYFTPDPGVLDKIGLSRDDKYIIIRFVAWNATHDITYSGISKKEEMIKSLSDKYKIFITSEKKLPVELEKYKISISPVEMHHLMYYAHLFIGESLTMTSESAILGTPGILVSSAKGGNTNELEKVYDMVYTFSDKKNAQEKAIYKAKELLDDNNVKMKWEEKRNKLLREKIDVTQFMTEFIENFQG